MGNRRPGYLTRYAKSRGITVRQADYQLKKCGIVTSAYFDFDEADRRRAAWTTAGPGNGSAGDGSAPVGSLGEAQTRERQAKAALAEIELGRRRGELVERDAVEKEAFRVGRLVRDALMNIPSRLAGILAAESDQRRVYELLDKEIRQALEALACDAGITDRSNGTLQTSAEAAI
ncbi:hypothetical protein [Nitrospira moscoviensis]|uniref:Terminase small subunit n=1 Tax=Nitrospira moscoviensis TaxID=42253 RepID=A0A0K2GH67_NITMO|nr:hypothetical protein [Nitrospira moscoviensis]ALA60199.1 hypothetical protein NITMOv2_3809 [Nitrospira moscoviensis]